MKQCFYQQELYCPSKIYSEKSAPRFFLSLSTKVSFVSKNASIVFFSAHRPQIQPLLRGWKSKKEWVIFPTTALTFQALEWLKKIVEPPMNRTDHSVYIITLWRRQYSSGELISLSVTIQTHIHEYFWWHHCKDT